MKFGHDPKDRLNAHCDLKWQMLVKLNQVTKILVEKKLKNWYFFSFFFYRFYTRHRKDSVRYWECPIKFKRNSTGYWYFIGKAKWTGTVEKGKLFFHLSKQGFLVYIAKGSYRKLGGKDYFL